MLFLVPLFHSTKIKGFCFYIHVSEAKLPFSPLSLIKLFPELGWQQAADPVIREEHIKVPQEAPLGLIRFIFRFQHLVGNNLE